MIIKNFLGAGYENNGLEEFRISWDYISLENGTEIGPKNFAIPDNLITEEFILGWDTLADLPVYGEAGDAISNPIGWYTDTFFLEYYFIAADKVLVGDDLNLKVPNSYNSTEVQSGLISPLEQFRKAGRNFPGQSALANKFTVSSYPGLASQVGAVPIQDTETSSIFESLTRHLTGEIEKSEWHVRNSWETDFGPQAGTAVSSHIFGLDRTDYAFTIGQLLKDSVIATLPTDTAIPTSYIYIAYDKYGNLAGSFNSLTDFKHGAITSPADLAIVVVDFTSSKITPTKTTVYNANGLEGTILTHTTTIGLIQTIVLGPDRLEPEVVLPDVITSTQFQRGFKYKHPITQTSFPPGFISLTPTTGKFPYNSVRPYNIKPHSFGVFNGKNTRHATEFFFKLFRLRRGREYNTTLDVISTGPNDLDILELWDLPTLVVESLNDNNFVAGALVGYDTNCVSVRLPFSYKRGQKEWVLAHKICEAFLQNYTIGYHEFVADFSAADEPVFLSSVIVTDTPPTDIVLSPAVLPSLNQNIGTLSVVDNNLFGTYNYSIIGGALASKLSVTAPNILKLQTGLDGSEVGYNVEIEATDETNLTYQKLISITYDSKDTYPLAVPGNTDSYYVQTTPQTKQELVVTAIPILSITSSTNSFNLLN